MLRFGGLAVVAMTSAAILMTVGSAANASPRTWLIQNVRFEDGGTLTGQFDYDASSGKYSNISIAVTGRLFGGATKVFRDSDQRTSSNSSSLNICESSCPGGSKYFKLTFKEPLTGSGGRVPVVVNRDSSYYGMGWFFLRKGAQSGLVASSGSGQSPSVGGSPEAIAQCMKKILYVEKKICTDAWGRADGSCSFSRTEQVRTGVSESAAAQACQNAR